MRPHRTARALASGLLSLLLAGSAASAVAAPRSGARAGAPPDPSAQPMAAGPAAEPAPPADGPALPPNHPALPAEAPAPLDQPPSQVSAALELPSSTIEVRLRDENGTPLAATPVALSIQHQDVGEGDSTRTVQGRTDGLGVARFDDLPTGSAYSFQALVDKGPARYRSEPVALRERSGQRIVLTIFPVTRDLRQVMVGSRAAVFIQPREDVFQFEVSYELFNLGRVTWVPDDVRVTLPQGWKAFDGGGDAEPGLHRKGDVLRLVGSITPGQHTVSFRFQVPNDHRAAKRFELGNLPHVVELRVIAEASALMRLEVAGFDPAQPFKGTEGERLLVTQRRVVPGQHALDALVVELADMPVPSRGRWYAAGLATALGLWGLTLTRRRRGGLRDDLNLPAAELQRARTVLLDELVLLEGARARQEVGPDTYQRTRERLIDALARLEQPTTGPTDRAG